MLYHIPDLEPNWRQKICPVAKGLTRYGCLAGRVKYGQLKVQEVPYLLVDLDGCIATVDAHGDRVSPGLSLHLRLTLTLFNFESPKVVNVSSCRQQVFKQKNLIHKLVLQTVW